MMRAFFLYLSQSTTMQDRIVRFGMTRRASRRFVAGETLEEALRAVAQLNQKGGMASLNCLGENVENEAEARAAQAEYLRQIEAIRREGLNSNISVKLTQLGLDISRELCLQLAREILARAQEHGMDVEVDMESSAYTDATLEIVHRLRDDFEGVGVAIQAYLRRSEKDLPPLMERGIKIRLVKGAYREPKEIAFPKKRQVDENYRKLMHILLESAPRFAIATHDERLVRDAVDYIKNHNLDNRYYEFQMIYGIRRDLQRQMMTDGWRFRVYVPYGTHWYPYFMRRLAERPANVFFVLRNLFRG